MKTNKYDGKQILCAAFFYLYLIHPFFSLGQGCSDAGFCSMGAMKPDQKFNKNLSVRLRSIEVGQYIGRTKFEDYILATNFEVNVGINKKSVVQFKIPFSYVINKVENTSGAGDISLSYTYNILNKERNQVNATIGAKIPTGKGDLKSKEGRPLSMYLQPSLGTFDLVLGLSYISRNWLIATGYQKVLVNNNENAFTKNAWEDFPDPVKRADAQRYPNANRLERSSDVMLRVERNLRFSNINFHLGLLNIYRFRKDRITDPATGEKLIFNGSEGIAITLIVGTTYYLNTKNGLKFLFGNQLLQRNANPDGLRREQVLQFGYFYSF